MPLEIGTGITIGGGITLGPAPIPTPPLSGEVDSTFVSGSGFNGVVLDMSVLSNESIVLGGGFTTYNGAAQNRITRLFANGVIDISFATGVGFDGTVQGLLVTLSGSDEIVTTTGEFTTYKGLQRSRIARILPNGNNVPGFLPGLGFQWNLNFPDTNALAFNELDGKFVVGGRFTTYNGSNRQGIALIGADGSLDLGFDPGSGFQLGGNQLAAVIQDEFIPRKIVVGGDSTTYNGNSCPRLVRLNYDGSLDSTFNSGGSGPDARVINIHRQSDGKMVLTGQFSSYNSINAYGIARINANGSLDNTFSPGTGFNDDTFVSLTDDNGRIYVGGRFTSYNGTSVNRLCRLNPNGSLDTTFVTGTGFNNDVYALSWQKNKTNLLVGGLFTTYNGTSANRIIRLK